MKEKRRKDCVTEWLESEVLGKTGTLEKEATSGPKALWQKPEVKKKTKGGIKRKKHHAQRNIGMDLPTE